MEEVKLDIEERIEIVTRDTDNRLAEYQRNIQNRTTEMENSITDVSGMLYVYYLLHNRFGKWK